MVDETSPFFLGAASAGNQILGRDREEEGSVNSLEPREEENNKRAQPNQDDGDRVEISSKSRQRLEANNVAASNEAATSPLDRVQNAIRPEPLGRPSQIAPNPRTSIEKTIPSEPPDEINANAPGVASLSKVIQRTNSQQGFSTGNLNSTESANRLDQSGPVDSDFDQGGAVTRNQFNLGTPDPRQLGEDAVSIESIISNDQTLRGAPDARRSGSSAIRAEEVETNIGDQVIERNPDSRRAGNAATTVQGARGTSSKLIREARPASSGIELKPIEPAGGNTLEQANQANGLQRENFEPAIEVEVSGEVPQQQAFEQQHAQPDSSETAEKRPQTVVQTIRSSVAGQLAQRPDQADSQGRIEVQASPRQNLTQQQININTDSQPDQGNSRQGPRGQNPVAQQIRQNASPEPVGSNPRAALAGQNPIEETVKQNNAAAKQIRETIGTDSQDLELVPPTGNEPVLRTATDQQRQINEQTQERLRFSTGPISFGVEQVRAETAKRIRALPEQDIKTILDEAKEIRHQKVSEARATGEPVLRLPELADEPVLPIPEQDISSLTIERIRPVNNPRELGETFTENAHEARAERTEEQQQAESVENEEQQREVLDQESRNRGPVAEQIQLGRNVDRLI